MEDLNDIETILIDVEKKPKRAQKWTNDEDEALKIAVKKFGGCSWKEIAQLVETRNDLQCFHRWQKVLKPGLTKGPWTKDEDDIIIQLVKTGEHKWASIAKQIPGRLGKQIRERYFNHLDPSIKKEPWSVEEDLILRKAQESIGNKWARIAKMIPGRPENMVKNRWSVLNYPRKRKLPNKPRPYGSKRRTPLCNIENKRNLENSIEMVLEQVEKKKLVKVAKPKRKAKKKSSRKPKKKIDDTIVEAAKLLLSLTECN